MCSYFTENYIKSFTTIPTTQIASINLIKRSPLVTAKWLPSQPPRLLPAAEARPIGQHILLLKINTINANNALIPTMNTFRHGCWQPQENKHRQGNQRATTC